MTPRSQRNNANKKKKAIKSDPVKKHTLRLTQPLLLHLLRLDLMVLRWIA